jgi:glycine cleavage system H lipoate-binding protein
MARGTALICVISLSIVAPTPFPEPLLANVPGDLLYTPEHEYVRRTADPVVVEIGITDYAQGELGDIVFVDLPKPGATFSRMAVFGTVEAVKAVSELFCPVSGEVIPISTTTGSAVRRTYSCSGV